MTQKELQPIKGDTQVAKKFICNSLPLFIPFSPHYVVTNDPEGSFLLSVHVCNEKHQPAHRVHVIAVSLLA